MAGRNQHHVQRSQRPAGSGDADTRHVLQAGDEDIRAAFDMGVNVRTRVKRSSKQQLSSSPTLRRKVVNCLKCGKASTFLASGACTHDPSILFLIEETLLPLLTCPFPCPVGIRLSQTKQ